MAFLLPHPCLPSGGKPHSERWLRAGRASEDALLTDLH